LATCNRYDKGKGCKLMALGDAHGLPIAIHREAAAPAEVKLVEATLAARLVEEKPLRIIADKAYDSGPLREQLLAEEILLLARTVVAEPNPPSTMAGGCAAITSAGKANGSSPGSTTL
jgi:hypothetical protein